MPPIRSRVLFALALLALAGTAAVIPFCRNPTAGVDRVRPGMTLAEVEALLGPAVRTEDLLTGEPSDLPRRDGQPVRWVRHWRLGHEHAAQVLFDPNGRAVAAEHGERFAWPAPR